MNLELQIQSLIFSFVFGLFFSLMFNLFYKYLFRGKVFFRIISNFIFVMANTLLYFLCLKLINNGIIHIYFIIMLFLGFILGNKKTKTIRKFKLDTIYD